MKVTKQETLYHKDHGATLKHKCGKRIVALFLLFFIFFIWPFFCKVRSLIPTCGGIIVSIILSSPGQCSNNEDHHTFIYLQLKITTQYLEKDMTLYECLWRCTRMGNETRVTCMKNYAWWPCHKYDVNYMIMQRAI